MKRRIHLKSKRLLFSNSRKNLFWMTIFLILFILVLVFRFIGNTITPGIISYAQSEITKFATRIINDVITNELKEVSINDIFLITKDKDDYIRTIDYNPITVNQILANVTSKIERNLRNVENGENLFELSDNILSTYDINKLKRGIIFEIAVGAVLKNPLLVNIGPKIPVRISLLGNTSSHINTKITNYGINNALVETSVLINVNIKIVLPYETKEIDVSNSIPIAIKLIQGNIPNYYFNGIDKNSPSYIIPVE